MRRLIFVGPGPAGSPDPVMFEVTARNLRSGSGAPPRAFTPAIPSSWSVEDHDLMSAAVGAPAPDWALKTPSGETVSAASLRGKIVVLDFWASWCPFCRQNLPLLADLTRDGYNLWQSRYGGRSSVIGETIRLAWNEAGLNEIQAEIAGVLPPDIRIPFPTPFFEHPIDVWSVLPEDMKLRLATNRSLLAIGRLQPGRTLADAQASSRYDRLPVQHPSRGFVPEHHPAGAAPRPATQKTQG